MSSHGDSALASIVKAATVANPFRSWRLELDEEGAAELERLVDQTMGRLRIIEEASSQRIAAGTGDAGLDVTVIIARHRR
jgi:hypothetical protein